MHYRYENALRLSADMLTSLFESLAMVNKSSNLYNSIYMTENKKKHDRSSLT